MATSELMKAAIRKVKVYSIPSVSVSAHTQANAGTLPDEYKNADFYAVRALSNGGILNGSVESYYQVWVYNSDQNNAHSSAFDVLCIWL